MRVAINLGNPVLAQLHPITSEPLGVSVFLARALARRLDLRLELTTFDSAGMVFDAVDRDAWDLAFMAVEAERAQRIAFSPPYVFIDGTYLVRRDARFQSVADLDIPGRRIAVGRGAAYDLFLSRSLRHAELVRVATSAQAIAALVDDVSRLDAAAGIRQALVDAALDRPELQVLDDRFVRIEQAIAVPVKRRAALHYIRRFLAQVMRSGQLRAALDASGQSGATVAPPSAD